MAGAGKKTFTAGETLTASDVNSYLMEQSVMYFGGTAARASAIPTPSTGMTSYIGVTGTATIPQLETYTGSQWQTPYGSTLLANVTMSAASSVTIDNVFSSAYQNYLVLMNTNNTTSLQFRSGGSTIATGTYFSAAYYSDSGGNAGATNFGSNLTAFSLRNVNKIMYSFNIMDPFTAAPTFVTGNYIAGLSSVNSTGFFGGLQTDSTSMQGLVISGSSMTGNIRIYGLRNS